MHQLNIKAMRRLNNSMNKCSKSSNTPKEMKVFLVMENLRAKDRIEELEAVVGRNRIRNVNEIGNR